MQAWSDNQKSANRKAELACLVAMKKVQEVVERKAQEKEKKTHARTYRSHRLNLQKGRRSCRAGSSIAS
jgi:hypothetical protein